MTPRNEQLYKRKREAMNKLNRAFDYLRPRMQGDAFREISPNAEAEAGSILSKLIVELAFDRDLMRRGIEVTL